MDERPRAPSSMPPAREGPDSVASSACGSAPRRQRSVGRVHLRAGSDDGTGATRILDLAEAGPSRLRFPRIRGTELEAVLVNTAGGIACGDDFAVAIDLARDGHLVLTTTAAEKIYRSDGPVSRIDNTVTVGVGARLAWLPQETILFDRARVRRRFDADLAPDASLIVFEAVAFGRAARGEAVTQALFSDHWRIRRSGRLVYADSLHLDGAVTDNLARPAIGGDARACATLLDLSPGAERRLAEARAFLEDAGARSGAAIEAGVSAWNGHLAVRLLGREIGTLRAVAARLIAAYRAAPMPRVWQS